MKKRCYNAIFLLCSVITITQCQSTDKVYTKNGKATKIAETNKIIILRNAASCSPCFTVIDSLLFLLNLNDRACIVSTTNENAISMRLSEETVTKLTPHIKSHYFIINHNEDNIFDNSGKQKNIFTKNKIENCPSVILLSDKKNIYNYSDIFFVNGQLNEKFITDLQSLTTFKTNK